jgi:hypothetical protein
VVLQVLSVPSPAVSPKISGTSACLREEELRHRLATPAHSISR